MVEYRHTSANSLAKIFLSKSAFSYKLAVGNYGFGMKKPNLS